MKYCLFLLLFLLSADLNAQFDYFIKLGNGLKNMEQHAKEIGATFIRNYKFITRWRQFKKHSRANYFSPF